VQFGRLILAPILGEFLALYPKLRFQLQLLGATDTSPRERNFDVLIRPGPFEDSGLLVRPLMRIPLAVYASPRYLESRGVPDSPAALRHHSCISSSCGVQGEPGDSALWRLRRGSDLQIVRVESRVSVPDPTLSYQLAVGGAGVALLAQSATRADVNHGRLVRLLPDWELHAVYPSRLNSSPNVRVFLQFLRERCGDGPVHEVTTTTLPDRYPPASQSASPWGRTA
jgi:DNA-binding transcriptional LysR family regulator